MLSPCSRVAAHRNVLYGANDYFKALFTTKLKEKGQHEISIKDVDGAVLQQLVGYCYSGEIGIDISNAKNLTKAANMFRFTEVLKNCAAFYSSILSASTCLGIREIADLHNLGPLMEAAHDFMLDNFSKVFKCDEFNQLSAEHLSVLLKDDEINVTSEEEVFMALMGWVKYDISNRKQSFGALLGCVRFQHIKESVSSTAMIILVSCAKLNET